MTENAEGKVRRHKRGRGLGRPRTINEMPIPLIAGLLRTLSKGMPESPELDVKL